MKRFFAILLTLVLMLSLAACGGKGDGNAPSSSGQQTQQPSDTPDPGTSQTGNEKSPEEAAEEIASGFGSYNGQTIVWRVLNVDTENEKALLISRDILDKKQFHDESPASVYWEASSLREWLNGDFFNAAFNSEEVARIIDAEIIIANSSEYGTSSGNPTTDKIFLLSEEEVNRYFADNEDRRSESLVEEKGLEDWWTLTSGESEEYAVIVLSEGSILSDGYGKDQIEGVRPAIWVNLSDEANAVAPSGNPDPGTSEPDNSGTNEPSGPVIADGWEIPEYPYGELVYTEYDDNGAVKRLYFNNTTVDECHEYSLALADAGYMEQTNNKIHDDGDKLGKWMLYQAMNPSSYIVYELNYEYDKMEHIVDTPDGEVAYQLMISNLGKN